MARLSFSSPMLSPSLFCTPNGIPRQQRRGLLRCMGLALGIVIVFSWSRQCSIAYAYLTRQGDGEFPETATAAELGVSLSREVSTIGSTSHALLWHPTTQAKNTASVEAGSTPPGGVAARKHVRREKRTRPKVTPAGILGLTALLALCLGRSFWQADTTGRLKLGLGAEMCQWDRSLYSGTVDNQKVHKAALGMRAATFMKLEQSAAVLAEHLDTPAAKESLKRLRDFAQLAKQEEQRLEEQPPSALSTREAEEVARATRARAVLDVLRQQFDHAVGEAAILHRLAQRFVAEASEEASLLEARIQKKNESLRLLAESTESINEGAGTLAAHVLSVANLAKMAEEDRLTIHSVSVRFNTRKCHSPMLTLMEAIEAVENALEIRARMRITAAEVDFWAQEGEEAAKDGAECSCRFVHSVVSSAQPDGTLSVRPEVFKASG